MKQIMDKKSKLFSLVLILSLIAGIFSMPTNSYSAATQKATLSTSEYYMGAGSLSREGNFYAPSMKHTIYVENPVKKATYTFTSSDTKVVTVKTSGTKAYLTGHKAGKATITCNQKLNGKTTKVGTTKVVVSAPKVVRIENELCIGTKVLMNSYDSVCQINNRNTSAKYTYKSNSKDFTMWEVKEPAPAYSKDAYLYLQKYTAKKAGVYTITVNETVGKTTKKVGSFKIRVVAPSFEKDLDMYVGDEFYVSRLVNNPKNNDYSSYSIDAVDFDPEDNNSVVKFATDEDGYTYLVANKEGTAKIEIIETAAKKKVATVTLKVTIAHAEEIEYDLDEEFDLDDGEAYFYALKSPYNAIEELKVTSSDPNIAEVTSLDYGDYKLTLKSAGKVTITFSCGSIEYQKTVTIVNDSDDDYDYDDDSWDDDYDF